MAARKVQITMKTPARRRVGLLLASLCLPLFAQAAETQPTHEFSLDNGLKVIVREDHRAPVVVSQLWYRIGSSYETPGLTGLSHALEHMMFKGSRKLGPGEASRVLRDLGAEENAFTTDDYTAYYQVLARDRLPVALEMEADRMAHLSLPADQFKSEIEVIKEERRLRTDDNPNALAFERFKAAAYPASGYHTPTIGWMADLQRMKHDRLVEVNRELEDPNVW
ncbi:M16 family metallopeptidase, partial [Pseudomonas aeruginosa]|uniref:M16 family metallopeptidase n=1 Tax=Pseudomonas aeruginosa TaxID=287 RepID=UPI0039686EA2